MENNVPDEVGECDAGIIKAYFFEQLQTATNLNDLLEDIKSVVDRTAVDFLFSALPNAVIFYV